MASPKTLIALSCLLCVVLALPEPHNIVRMAVDQALLKGAPLQHFSAIQTSYRAHSSPEIFNYAKGSMSTSSTTKVTPSTLFGLGDVTAQFTAVLLLRKLATGEIDMQNSISTYLADYFNGPTAWPVEWKDVTVAQLLNGSSGIPDYMYAIELLRKKDVLNGSAIDIYSLEATAEQVVNFSVTVWNAYSEECQRAGECFVTGTAFKQSKTGYMIASMIAKELYGESIQGLFNGLLLTDINEQLKSHDAYLATGELPAEIRSRIADGTDARAYDAPINVTNVPWNFMSGASGLIGTTEALTTLTDSLFRGYLLDGKNTDIFRGALFVDGKSGRLVENFPSDCAENGCEGLGVTLSKLPELGLVYSTYGPALGYVSNYLYSPCYDFLITSSVNSGQKSGDLLILNLEIMLEMKLTNQLERVGDEAFCPSEGDIDQGFLSGVYV